MKVKIHEDRIDAIEKISEALDFRVGSGTGVGPKHHDVGPSSKIHPIANFLQ